MDRPDDIPLSQIDATSLPRDRTALDPVALDELTASIRAQGLRLPVELHVLPATLDGPLYGLVSGFRRLTAIRALAADSPADPRWHSIPAFVTHIRDRAALLRLMVEENDARADVTPWDQGRVAHRAVPDPFATLDAAVAGLYPTADRQRRARIRSIAAVVADLGGVLKSPESLSMRKLERLAAACRGGFTELITCALSESRAASSEAQWEVLENVLREAESEARTPAPDPRPGRPRRFIRPRPDLTIRRELTRDGWCLRFTGRAATGAVMEEIMDAVEEGWGCPI